MSSNSAENASYAEHQAAWESLPWYVNGTLDAEELARLERHVASCVACRSEVKYLRELGAAVHAAEDFPLAPARGLAALMARIEESEEPHSARAGRPSQTRRLLGWSAPFRQAPTAIQRLLLAQVAAIVLLVGILAWPGGEVPSATYRTLAEDAELQADLGSRLHVVFDPETPEHRIREILKSVQAEIIAGPSAVGLYTLAMPVSEEAGLSVRVVLEKLRAHPEVTFAEPATR